MPMPKQLYAIVMVYEAYNTDADGRYVSSIGHYSAELKAKEVASSPNGRAPQTSTRHRPTIKVGDEYFLLVSTAAVDVDHKREKKRREIRRSAMAKLTKAELEELGLLEEDENDFGD